MRFERTYLGIRFGSLAGDSPIVVLCSCRTTTLRDNPAAVAGLLESFGKLLQVALDAPYYDLSTKAFEDALAMTKIFLGANDSSSAVKVVEKLPSLVAKGIDTPSELDSSTARLAQLCVVIAPWCLWSTCL